MKHVAMLVLSGAIGLALSLGACSKKTDRTQTRTMAETTSQAAQPSSTQPTALRAVANLQPTQGNTAQGTVTFTQEGEGVRISAHVTKMAPGKHGIHIHENGDCSAPDASSAGGHFNPTGRSHGGPMAAERHVGDMGNIAANDNGEGHLEYVDRAMSLLGPNSIIGKAVVVHAQADDLKSQPAGNSGARVACGVITAEQSAPGGQ